MLKDKLSKLTEKELKEFIEKLEIKIKKTELENLKSKILIEKIS